MKEIKNIIEKTKTFVSSIDKESVEKFAEKARKETQAKLKEYGVDEKIEELKKEGVIIKDSISKSATEVYKENEDLLEKPVAKASEVIKKITEHSTTIKWAGAITAGVVAPVPTLVASSLLYLLSSDEEKEKITEENKNMVGDVKESAVVKSTAEMMKNKEILPEKVVTKNEWVEVTIDLSNKTAFGILKKGNWKGTSFDQMGIDNMKDLANQLPETETALEAKSLINYWVSWKESK